MRRLLVCVAALAALMYAAAPPAARPLPPPPAGVSQGVRGVVHVHTRRSDGSGSVASVARAAARAGLQFVILTDHGDATRNPDAPAYHDGVLVIDAVEISTEGGHVVALGLPRSPYPLAGEARDVVEDVHRMGGIAIAAHPASRKGELQWTDWSVPVDGFEYLNGDSEWRDEPWWRLVRTVLAYPVRPAESLAMLFDRSDEVFARWDSVTATRRLVALPAADAHGRIGLRAEDPYRGRIALPVPGYESVFRSASLALPAARLTSDAAADARMVVEEIAAGRAFASVDAFGWRPAFDLSATSGGVRVEAGESLPTGGPVHVAVAVQAPPDAEIVLLRNGALAQRSRGTSLKYDGNAGAAVYRAEVRMPGAPGEPPVPWIVSNPIYVGRSGEPDTAPGAQAAVTSRSPLYTDGPAPEWVIEHSSESQGAVDVAKALTGTQLVFRFALSGGASSHPFAALAVPAGPAIAGYDRLTFTARADNPMRLSVQLRNPTSDPPGERWHRSVFLDETPREITVRFDDMHPRGPTRTPKPPLDRIGTVLFVVDTVNTATGTAGRVAIDDVRYER